MLRISRRWLTMGLSFAIWPGAKVFIHYDVMTSITIEILWVRPVHHKFFYAQRTAILSFCMSATAPVIIPLVFCHRVKSHLVDCHRTGAIYIVFTVLLAIMANTLITRNCLLLCSMVFVLENGYLGQVFAAGYSALLTKGARRGRIRVCVTLPVLFLSRRF